MNLVGAGARDGVYDSSRGCSVLGRVVASQDGKLLNSVYAEVSAKYAPGTAIGIIVNADAINTVIVLLGAAARDAHLRPKSAIGIARSMGLCGNHSGLEIGKVGPRAAVQR